MLPLPSSILLHQGARPTNPSATLYAGKLTENISLGLGEDASYGWQAIRPTQPARAPMPSSAVPHWSCRHLARGFGRIHPRQSSPERRMTTPIRGEPIHHTSQETPNIDSNRLRRGGIL
jgi:hypothetical protein